MVAPRVHGRACKQIPATDHIRNHLAIAVSLRVLTLHKPPQLPLAQVATSQSTKTGSRGKCIIGREPIATGIGHLTPLVEVCEGPFLLLKIGTFPDKD